MPFIIRIQTFSSEDGIDEIGGLGKVHVDRVVLEIDGGDAEESSYCSSRDFVISSMLQLSTKPRLGCNQIPSHGGSRNVLRILFRNRTTFFIKFSRSSSQ